MNIDVSKPMNKPLRKMWMSFGIDGIRGTESFFSTYEGFENEVAPPLPTERFNGSLDWLRLEGRVDREYLETYGSDMTTDAWTSDLDAIVREAQSLEIELPRAYLELMRDADLRNFFYSPTACYFNAIGESIVPLRDRPGEYLLRFYNDQQDCCFWYLHLTKDGAQVVMSEFDFEKDYDLGDYQEYLELSEDQRREGSWHALWLSATDFESFLYRVWIEGEIWFRNEGEDDFTPLEQEYVDFFLEK